MQKALVAPLVVLTIGLTVVFWLLPMSRIVADRPYVMMRKSVEAPTPGVPPPPVTTEEEQPKPKSVQAEITGWLEIAGKFSPLVTMYLAIRTSRKNRKKR